MKSEGFNDQRELIKVPELDSPELVEGPKDEIR
jgi:hypothetical protein